MAITATIAQYRTAIDACPALFEGTDVPGWDVPRTWLSGVADMLRTLKPFATAAPWFPPSDMARRPVSRRYRQDCPRHRHRICSGLQIGDLDPAVVLGDRVEDEGA